MIYPKNSLNMDDVPESSVHLVVTSPPYPMVAMWDDVFLSAGAAEYSQMHEYLARIWKQCYLKLVDGGIMAINIGDATRKVRKVFQIFPNHAQIIVECRKIGFVALPCILWKKHTNKHTSFLGSGMLPPNGYVTQDCEYILLFRKGLPRKFPPKDENRYASAFTQDQRNEWFSQIWTIPGRKQTKDGYEKRTGAFPDEIPSRLIQMFSVRGDTVLDPFAGTGTTIKVANSLGRLGIGYEINTDVIDKGCACSLAQGKNPKQ